MSGQIPTVDLEAVVLGHPDADAIVARQLKPAMEEWGAFYLTNHGIDRSIIDAAFEADRLFFSQSLEERMKIKVDKDNRGYVPMHQTHYPGNKPDLKESFNVGMGLTKDDPEVAQGVPLHGVNRWPDLPGFREPVETYFNALTDLGMKLLGPLAICLDLDPAELRAKYTRPVAFMRLFHYPVGDDLEGREFGAAEHKDYGFLTILMQDTSGGLDVRSPKDEIVAVPPRQDAFIVNVGDLLAEITNQRFRSPLHRVVNRARVPRYSIPFFFDPNFEARFDSLPDVTAGEFLVGKFDKFYKNRKKESA
jgi:isopenicillin N synthase-like dioxygenase